MSGYFKQKKKGSSVISKAKGGVKKKTPPRRSAALLSDVVQPPARDPEQDYDENEQLLRQFDMNLVYGPCIDMSRLDRWNRAKKFGLNPPEEVKVLLQSGKEVQTECLWRGTLLDGQDWLMR